MDAYVIPVNEDLIPTALEIAYGLRKEGIITDIDLLRRGMGKSLKYANTLHARTAIIVGPKELENNAVTVRNLQSGEQTLVKRNEIASFVKLK
jgi:histidyl-tRNA synthetase